MPSSAETSVWRRWVSWCGTSPRPALSSCGRTSCSGKSRWTRTRARTRAGTSSKSMCAVALGVATLPPADARGHASRTAGSQGGIPAVLHRCDGGRSGVPRRRQAVPAAQPVPRQAELRRLLTKYTLWRRPRTIRGFRSF